MIILEVRIYAFGGLKNKTITFNEGINIIYGENEKGKSTIENFIKIMLYGISKRRGKEERERYVHNIGIAKGELIVLYDGRKLLIKRSFGKTKKEDTSVIIDYDTGERINNIDVDSPGRTFFNINRSTFEKTLFIGQLGVSFIKDKEEEIMDKITSMFGVEESEVPAIKAIEKIESLKKNLHTVRGIGKIDQLIKQKDKLLEQKFEAIKISQKNIEWENELLLKKKKRKDLNDEISKLEIYKKYIKKINIQKEYKEINDYLMKSQNLRQKEEEMDSELIKGKEVIDLNFINKLKEYNNNYLFVNNKYKDVINEINGLNERFETLNNKSKHYNYLDDFDKGIKNKLISLKYEIKSFKDEILRNEQIIKNIKNDEQLLNNLKKQINNFGEINTYCDELEKCLNDYEDKLRTLSYLMENDNSNYNEHYYNDKQKKLIIKTIINSLFFLVGVTMCIIGLPYIYVGIAFIILSLIFLFFSIKDIKVTNKNINELRKINNMQGEVTSIENKLDEYCVMIKVNDYKELLLALRKYKEFKEHEKTIKIKIDEKRKIINYSKYDNIKLKYKKDNDILKSLKNVSKCNEIDEILKEIDEYEDIKLQIQSLAKERNSKINELKNIECKLKDIKEKLINNLNIMGVSEYNILDINKVIAQYEEKIRKREEIHGSLISIEETYKYLIKDKNIDDIKNELQNIIKSDNTCFYKSEDEIEVEEKKKSRELIECEKSIKDLENNINTRLIGKKSLIEIKEQLYTIEEEIKTGEKEYRALSIALEYILKAEEEIRRNIGPKINKLVSQYFKELTDEKYNEVIINDRYEMMVRFKDTLLEQKYLSSGALDQLYLCLRIAFIILVFNKQKYITLLDDAFVQYDDIRRERALLFLINILKGQFLIFTCQKNETEILQKNNIKFSKIIL